jgi:outer membrane lipoprotein carrier protein
MRLEDNLGQVTEIRFSNEVRNGPVDPALFDFVPPPGVDVVSGSAL